MILCEDKTGGFSIPVVHSRLKVNTMFSYRIQRARPYTRRSKSGPAMDAMPAMASALDTCIARRHTRNASAKAGHRITAAFCLNHNPILTFPIPEQPVKSRNGIIGPTSDRMYTGKYSENNSG